MPVPSQDHPVTLLCLFQARTIPPHYCACSKLGPSRHIIVLVPSQDHPATLLCMFQARTIPPHDCACSKPGPSRRIIVPVPSQDHPATWMCLFQARTCISNAKCIVFFCVQWFDVKGHVVVWIVDHHCLNFKFTIVHSSNTYIVLGTISVSSHLQELLYRDRNYLSLFIFTGAAKSYLELSQSLHIYRSCYIVIGTILVSSHLQELLYRARIYLSLFTFTGAVISC